MNDTLKRCGWAGTNESLIPYHDNQWGVPVFDDRLLFEMITLEGAQAGLSWLTILKKRAAYRSAFNNFEPHIISQYDESKRDELMADNGIVRNRLKINAVIQNAKAFLVVEKECGSFSDYVWDFVENKPLRYAQREHAIKISELMSKTMKKRGFTFFGSTICFAFMQATGMINDHEPRCFLYKNIIVFQTI